MEIRFAIKEVASSPRFALRDVSFAVPAGKVCALVGNNGAGKSTLLDCVAKNLKIPKGCVFVGGLDVASLGPAAAGRTVAYVPQSNPVYGQTLVRDYVALGRLPRTNFLGILTRADRAAVDRALVDAGAEKLRDRRFETLSGGERQRAVIASALAQDAPVLLLDEPLAGLDLAAQDEACALVRRLADGFGKTVLAALHELDLAARFADFFALLSGGRLAAFGTPAQVLTAENIRAHFGAERRVRADADGKIQIERP